MPELVLIIMHGAALVVAGIAAVTDARTGHIPNWLTLPPLVLAPLIYGFLGGLGGFAWSVGGLLLCGFVPYVLFRKGAIGGGDVKLLAALGAICAWPPGPLTLGLGLEAQLYAFMAASVFALGKLAWEGKLLRTVIRTVFLCFNPLLPQRLRRKVDPELMSSVRLGIPIFAGTLFALVLRYPTLWGMG